MPEDLGPFQAFWEAWNEVGDEIRGKPFEHFSRAVEIQFEDMREHLDNEIGRDRSDGHPRGQAQDDRRYARARRRGR